MKALGLLVITMLIPMSTSACECAIGSVENGMRQSKYVFGAAVVGASVRGENLSVEIRNIVNIKGNFGGKKLSTRSSQSGCGLTMRVPEKYIFFVDEDGFFSSCSATRIFGDPDLGILNDQALNQWIDRARKASQH